MKKHEEFCGYVAGMAESGNDGELKRLLEEEKHNAEKNVFSLARIEALVKGIHTVEFRRMLKLPPASRSEAIDALVRKTVNDDFLFTNLPDFLRLVQEDGMEVLPELTVKLRAALAASDDPARRKLAERLAGYERSVCLKGNRLVLEGVFADGVEFDWEAYRGKTTLFFVWSAKSSVCLLAIPRLKELCRRYNDKLEVLGYNLDDSPAAVKKFEKKYSLPWENICRAATLKSRKAAGGRYLDPCEFYGMVYAPIALLVDPDGIVVNDNAMENLEAAVAEAFGRVPNSP